MSAIYHALAGALVRKGRTALVTPPDPTPRALVPSTTLTTSTTLAPRS